MAPVKKAAKLASTTSSSAIVSVVDKTLVKRLNANESNPQGSYVLYWVQAAPRVECNPALEYASERANHFKVPLVACFGVTQSFPGANARHYHFMLEGLADFKASLATARQTRLYVGLKDPDKLAVELSRWAIETVVDRGYLRIQRRWYDHVASSIDCLLVQVETNVVVPVELVSNREEYAAHTIRPKIWKLAPNYLKPISEVLLEHPSCEISELQSFTELDISSVSEAVNKLTLIDHSVQPVNDITGGHCSARKLLDSFIEEKLDGYSEGRNQMGQEFQSYMSPYLHYGHISPVEILMSIRDSKASKSSKDAYIEELLIRRELSMNFVWYNPDHYDSLECLPDWAKKTIGEHQKDKRQYIYSLEQLEKGQTHDRYWNACQLEMVHSGKMHGYMRMYWAKKVIEWTPDMQTAYDWLILLNDKYELDGRDPNGFAGVAWCFGKHDRAWTERPIHGKLRFMGSEGLKRKFKFLEAYTVRNLNLGSNSSSTDKQDIRGFLQTESNEKPISSSRSKTK